MQPSELKVFSQRCMENVILINCFCQKTNLFNFFEFVKELYSNGLIDLKKQCDHSS